MGCFSSKQSSAGSNTIEMESYVKACHDDNTVEMESYVEACLDDPNIRSFDVALQTRTNNVLNKVIFDINAHSLSFDSLREIPAAILDTSQEFVNIILNHIKEIWNDPPLFELVDEYFKNSLLMLDLCASLENCIKRTCHRQVIINSALRRFEEQEEDYIWRTLEELKRFKIEEDPFTEQFFKLLEKVQVQQFSMLEKLKLHKEKINKNVKSLKTWRKLSSLIFVTAVVAVVICSVVTSVVAAPPVAAALSAAASVPIGSAGKWFDSLLKRYQVARQQQGKLVSSMKLQTKIAISDFQNINVLVDKLEIQINAMVTNVEFVLGEEDRVRLGIEEIKKNLEMFMQSLEDLDRHTRKCSDHIAKGRTAILQNIINYKNGSD